MVTATAQHTQGWAEAQNRLAAVSSNSHHRIADTTHVGLLDDQHGSQNSVAAIDQVARSNSTSWSLV